MLTWQINFDPTENLQKTLKTYFNIFTKFKMYLLQASDLIRIHESKCCKRERYRPVQLSCDGVSECKSNLISLDVYSARFKDCRVVYPHTIIRPTPKYSIDDAKYLSEFINDMVDNGCTIKAHVADNLKRARARAALNHASSFPCEYCFSKACTWRLTDQQAQQKKRKLAEQKEKIKNRITTIEESEEPDEDEIEALKEILCSITNALYQMDKSKNQLVWPSSTMNGEPRTKVRILEIVDKIESGEPTTKDERMGIVGRSPFLELENFDFVRDIPAEYLHSVCLGVVKRLVSLTFDVGVNRPRVTKRKLTHPSVFNLLMCKIKVVHEFSRRARTLDFSVYKGQEYRNMILVFFPLVIECLEDNTEEKKNLA